MRHVSIALLLLLTLSGVIDAEPSRDAVLRTSADRLRAVDAVRDPLVAELAELGMEFLPYAVPILSAPERISRLAAAWCIGQMDTVGVAQPVLEELARAASVGQSCNAGAALQMMIQRAEGRRDLITHADPDAVSLFENAVCRSGMKFGHQDDSSPDTLLLVSSVLSEPNPAGCPGTVVIYMGEFPHRGDKRYVGKPYVMFGCEICDLTPPDMPMPYWESHMGEAATALALVDVSTSTILQPGHADMGMEGRADLWVKCDGKWRILARLATYMS